MQKPFTPDQLRPPTGEELVLIARAEGFQIYLCRADNASVYSWVFKAPEADLYDAQGNLMGKHFAGPTWRHNDGSEITGKVAAKADAPGASAIPWLLLTVSGHAGQGVLSRVTTIQRINTFGGLAPASGCGEANRDAEFRSSYTADYYFYARPRS
ncbi:MAG TPA: DUF3455 domain-containing protein [Candidatus Angelobacter sp.]|nr:DUF3455 domain-containing protein [Candidatus Angelobacter sp.]